jgi:hypothetical protein
MTLLVKSLLGASLGIVMALEAHALSITPATSTVPSLTFSSNSQSAIDAAINAYFTVDPILAYKEDVYPSQESGPFQASYETDFFNTPTDPAGATIRYVSGPKIETSEIYLLVKDGNHVPYAYLFDISSLWDGTEDLNLTSFWPQKGAISHVSIYTRGSAQVPDGGMTLMLLGIGLSGLAVARRLVALA